MKYIAILLVLNALLISCMTNDATVRQTVYYKQFENKPLTEKEKSYIKLLESKGYNKIDIQPPTIGVDFSGSSLYSVTLNSQIRHTNENVDSIRNINYEIAKELYKNVIEDSIVFDISNISVTLTIRNSFEKDSEETLNGYYSKSQLAKDLNFKVIKNGDGTFSRVSN